MPTRSGGPPRRLEILVKHVQTAQNGDAVTGRNFKTLQVLGLVIIVVVVVVIILKAISGEIDASTITGGFEITIVVAASILPAALLIVFSTLLKQQKQWDVNVKLVISIATIAASAIGAAASGFLATRSLLVGDIYSLVFLLFSPIPAVMPAEWVAMAVTAALIHYGVMVLYLISLPASIKITRSAIETYKAKSPPPMANIIPPRHPGVTSNFCRRCGALNDPQARFCNSCGGSMY